MSRYISFVVPVYNVEDYLEQCIESLLHQDIPESQYEIILVDDGSTDLSGKICEQYGLDYENVKCFRKENGGSSAARNYGLKRAEGKYILFVDSDDYIRENILGTIIRKCKAQNEPQVMFLMARKVFPDGKTRHWDSEMSLRALHTDYRDVVSYLAGRDMYPASAWGKLVSRDFLERYNIYFKEGHMAEDYEWLLSVILNATEYGCCNDNYYFYRQNRKGSITYKASEAHIQDLFQIIRNMEVVAADEKYKAVSEAVLKFAAYVYRCLLWNVTPYYKKYRSEIKRMKYLLTKKNSRDIKIIRTASKIVGIGNTVNLLGIYRKIKQKI